MREFFKAKAVSLVELMVVVIIIGILAAFAIPQYGKVKEKTLDHEAQGVLHSIIAAEKIYKTEALAYITCNDNASINTALLLNLQEGNSSWNFTVAADPDPNANGNGLCTIATRNGSDARRWRLQLAPLAGGVTYTSDNEPVLLQAGDGCF